MCLVKMRSHKSRVGPNLMTVVLIRREHIRETDPQGRSPCGKRGKRLELCCYELSNAADSQQLPEATRGKEGFFLRAFEGVLTRQHFDFGHLASKTMRT